MYRIFYVKLFYTIKSVAVREAGDSWHQGDLIKGSLKPPVVNHSGDLQPQNPKLSLFVNKNLG